MNDQQQLLLYLQQRRWGGQGGAEVVTATAIRSSKVGGAELKHLLLQLLILQGPQLLMQLLEYLKTGGELKE